MRRPFQFDEGDVAGGGGTPPEPTAPQIDPADYAAVQEQLAAATTQLGQYKSQNDQLSAAQAKWEGLVREAYGQDQEFATRLSHLLNNGVLPTPTRAAEPEEIDWADPRQRDAHIERMIEQRVSGVKAETDARQRSTEFDTQFLMLASSVGKEAAIGALPRIKQWMIQNNVSDLTTLPGGIQTAFNAVRDVSAERKAAIAEFQAQEKARVESIRAGAAVSSAGPHGTLPSYDEIREKEGSLAAIDRIMKDQGVKRA